MDEMEDTPFLQGSAALTPLSPSLQSRGKRLGIVFDSENRLLDIVFIVIEV